MQFKLASLIMVVSIAVGAFAGQNCKCQASNGQGPQWDDATKACCTGAPSIQFGTVLTCTKGFTGVYPGGSHQCDAKGSNCLDSGSRASATITYVLSEKFLLSKDRVIVVKNVPKLEGAAGRGTNPSFRQPPFSQAPCASVDIFATKKLE
ncbi:hypothetical protein BKA70DRAFT_1466125 [Coprinopsis sp. MPI-PUGE-AT-0042]|nr:hypothetical protein BKA70DRAFT_1466125 [Coprinopsis sp. MPI-PUGE-AT-0042]